VEELREELSFNFLDRINEGPTQKEIAERKHRKKIEALCVHVPKPLPKSKALFILRKSMKSPT
jgi:hypothetical protein